MTVQATSEHSPAAIAEHLREAERARLRALIDADIEQAQRFHTADFQLITPIGMALSKNEYLGAIASGHLKYLTWQPAEIAVRLYDGVAILRYRAQLEAIFGGHKVPLSDYWHTDTYEKHNEQWQVVWSQATSIKS
ncbi:nuclear transport factor 2 family protein [Pseudochrobactrum kiredjianiae]|uniref:Nuclear transport factor 2 family protein n=1 Tax=Pseudochrobactrum kiredjianiae TaxID=386305 RepID=A0ABW3V2A0_9HYPH|nr:nuclear transport factor 2 family protein [Pseudochrobactrum kiredjianiae]MDM7851169.1 nuclear transport factor 2 family protein [Pseudochrobactrum kiredjianiae]